MFAHISGFTRGVTRLLRFPLLFPVYVNDLADVLKNCQASLFADDTVIYCSSQTAIDLEAQLNEDLNHVKDWLNKHCIDLLSISKSQS